MIKIGNQRVKFDSKIMGRDLVLKVENSLLEIRFCLAKLIGKILNFTLYLRKLSALFVDCQPIV